MLLLLLLSWLVTAVVAELLSSVVELLGVADFSRLFLFAVLGSYCT